jgi:hypothetical protein
LSGQDTVVETSDFAQHTHTATALDSTLASASALEVHGAIRGITD